jgi:hypothetical protein
MSPDVHTVEFDHPVLRIVEALQQFEQRRLARAGGPTSARLRPASIAQGQVVQGRRVGPGRVGEAHLRRAMSPVGRQGHGRRRVGQLAGCLDQLQQPLRGAGGALQVAPDLRQGGEAAADHHRVEHERGQLAAAHAAADDLAAAGVDHPVRPPTSTRMAAGDKQGALADTRAGDGEGPLHLGVEGLGLRGFAVEALHRADVLDDLAGVGADAGHRCPGCAWTGRAPGGRRS